MTESKIIALISALRAKIEKENDNVWYRDVYNELIYSNIDNFINSTKYSELEKAFYLLLNQYPGDHKHYLVIPREMVLVPDIYEMKKPGYEYEIDFAIYAGSIDNPVKVAIECDGIRSHRQKHNNKDRRKDINLQAAGWLVFRFGSKEINEEIEKLITDDTYISSFLLSIENVISQKLRLIEPDSFSNADIRSKLTGYKWGKVTCPDCKESQLGKLNHKTIYCKHCNTKFKRQIHSEEQSEYEHDGIIFFKS